MKAGFRGAMVDATVAAVCVLESWSSAGCLGVVDSLPRTGVSDWDGAG